MVANSASQHKGLRVWEYAWIKSGSHISRLFLPPSGQWEPHEADILPNISRHSSLLTPWFWQVLQCQPGELNAVRDWGLRGGGGIRDPVITSLQQEIESLWYQHHKVYQILTPSAIVQLILIQIRRGICRDWQDRLRWVWCCKESPPPSGRDGVRHQDD